jgi:tetratricopeptide (TPR) repeat protein
MSVDQRVLEALRRYEALQEQGQTATPEELCRDCPELVPEVRRRLDLLRAPPAPTRASTQMDLPSLSPAKRPSPTMARQTAPDPAPEGTRYRPLRLHARGGLGEVLLAHDEELHREVALKRMQAHCAYDRDSRRRFLLEAEVTARLEHPGIVPVYGLVHDEAGQPSYAMRFIEGETLKDALIAFHAANQSGRDPGERTLALRKLLGDFVSVCKAVGYAHSRGVVHRDLKPQNVMLGKYGEVLVVDWGLAKSVEGLPDGRAGGEDTPTLQAETDEGTRLGTVLGTPEYMSPEQAEGRGHLLPSAGDIYSLGGMLYVVLTGCVPFQGANILETLGKVRRGEFLPPRQVNSDVPRPLEAICLKAMSRQAHDRYETALDLAEDVERWLADEPVTAYREPWTVRAGRWVRRRRTLVTSVGAALLVLVLGVVAVAWWYEQQQAQRDREEVLRLAERDKERALRLSETRSSVELALQEATTHGERIRALVNNPASWQTTLAAALSAVKRAETLLAREPELTNGTLGDRVRQLRARLDADEKDRVLVAAFEDVLFKWSQFDPRYKWDAAYQDLRGALARWGLPLAGLPVESASVLIQQRPKELQPQLAAILFRCLSWIPIKEKEEQQWLARVLVAADPDPWRQQVREAVMTANAKRFQQLVNEVDVTGQPVALLVAVAQSPLLEGKPGRMALLRRAQQGHPQDFWVNFELAVRLLAHVHPRTAARTARPPELPAVEDAIRFSTAAVAVRPQSPIAHFNLGLALYGKGDLAGAVACYRKAIGLDFKFPPAHVFLAFALEAQGDRKGAIAHYRKVLELDPRFALAHGRLANALHDQGHFKEAIDHYRKALDADPNSAQVHCGLGSALRATKDLVGAIDHYHKAINLDPKYAKAHYGLGLALVDQGNLKEAIASYRRALAIDPGYALAHLGLGTALGAQGNLKEAIACFKKTLELNPREALAHYNLGRALLIQGDRKGTIAHLQQAIALDPKLADAYGVLGPTLLVEGRFAEARASSQRALDLLSPKDPRRGLVTQHIAQADFWLRLEKRLPAILRGEDQPADAAEQLALADLCQRYQKRYAAAARFYSDAFAAGAAQSSQRAYSAACAAALAAAGQGEDAGTLDDKEKSRLRRQALGWLKDALKIQSNHLEDPERCKKILQTLQHWQKDADLTGVRDPKELTKLPEAERAAWKQFWNDVEKLVQKGKP